MFHGDWTVTIDASIASSSADSVSGFTVDTSMVQGSDYLATPIVLNPTNGDQDVPPNVVFTWTAPTGGSEATALIVDVEGDGEFQEAISLNGDLQITDQTWDPPADISLGPYEFFVNYINLLDETKVSTIITNGNINWLNPLEVEFGEPLLWPNNKALFTLEATTFVDFVVVPEPGTAVLLIMLAMTMGRIRRCTTQRKANFH